MMRLQDLLYKFEEGTGARYVKLSLLVLAMFALLLAYNGRCFRNFYTLEAMDAAQVGRNIAEGNGFSTLFVRPSSIYLLQKASGVPAAPMSKGTARLEGNHPDLANPPVYPYLLAGLFKVLRLDYGVSGGGDSFFNLGQQFWWYAPDFAVSFFNQILFLVVLVMTFFLARRLFEPAVAWVTTLLLLGTELLWKFANSGQSTTLLMLIFMILCWCLVRVEALGRDPLKPPRSTVIFAALAGVVLGIGAMTRYSFAWLLVPVALFLILFSGPNRVLCVAATVAACLVVMTPWMARNVKLSGLPFGTATLSVMQDSSLQLEGTKLERSLSPDLKEATIYFFARKFKTNIRSILADELPRFTGSWMGAFFLVGLMVAFLNPAPGRLRYFVVGSLVMFCLVQALGKTYLSTDSPEINSENLLVLLSPLVLMYGVSLFYILLERMALPFRELRLIVIGVFVAVNSLPMIMAFMPPRILPFAYPPYSPPTIQKLSSWMRPDELMMSDVPWAVAWYGHRQCVLLTLDASDDFYLINDYQKPIRALYLTPKTLDGRFITDWVKAQEKSWGSFVFNTVVVGKVPLLFPLRNIPEGFRTEQLFLADRQRW